MNSKIGLFLVLIAGAIIFSSSCEKVEKEIEDAIGTEAVIVVDGSSWDTKTVSGGQLEGTFVITATTDKKLLVLKIKELEVGRYMLKDTINSGFYTPDTDSMTNIYVNTGDDDFVEIIRIFDDGKKFDCAFEFFGMEPSGDSKTITGTMIEVPVL